MYNDIKGIFKEINDYMFQDLFQIHPVAAGLFSILLNIIISVAGVVPSAFLTAWNILYFGFSLGLIISIIGEALGAVISFVLYRKGLRKFLPNSKVKYKFLVRLKETEGIEAFFLVILLRVLPFAPSGVVTLTAAASKMGLVSFTISSTLGKIPALFIEAYSVHAAIQLSHEWGIMFALVIFVIILYFLVKILLKK